MAEPQALGAGPAADAAGALAALLVEARRSGTPLEQLPGGLLPADAAHAYRVQSLSLAALDDCIAGWKVGASAPDANAQCAPLPARGVHQAASGGAMPALQRHAFAHIGLELEIAFCFGAALAAARAPLSEAAVFEHVEEMLVTVEIVDSRWRHWPQVDKLAQLADLQNHGALITGARVPYDPGFDFAAPAMSLTCGAQGLFLGAGRNPAGDPRWLVTWLANELGRRGQALAAGTVVTAGSYVGVHFVGAPPETADQQRAAGPVEVAGAVEGIGEVRFTLI